jgi:hypothetical protein
VSATLVREALASELEESSDEAIELADSALATVDDSELALAVGSALELRPLLAGFEVPPLLPQAVQTKVKVSAISNVGVFNGALAIVISCFYI